MANQDVPANGIPPVVPPVVQPAPMDTGHWYDQLHLDDRTPDEFQVIIGLDGPSQARVREWISMVEYQGFDPLHICKCILRKAPSQREAQEDVAKMIVVAMTRGTVLSKVRKAISTRGAELVDRLIQRYSLVSTGTVGMDRKNALTLARICACFPVKCVHIMLLGGIEHPDQLPNYPWPLCFPAAAGVIPRHHIEMRELYKTWTLMFARRTTKRGATPASNEIAINLLEIGNDYYRCRMWNMCVFLINEMSDLTLAYSNGTSLVTPAEEVVSLQAAVNLVNTIEP